MECFDITEKIIGCVYRVYNTMGSGFLESVYGKCLATELEKADLKFETQKPVEVCYDNKTVGIFITDMLVEEKVIVELKAVKTLSVAHEVQLVNNLAATKMPVGLLIDFGESKVEEKRKNAFLPCK